ncbi:MAG: hypothetical protein AB7F40_00475 [Victivallaceae bacterium]|nr:hypothetical protein [Victivallaceae bacterium]
MKKLILAFMTLFVANAAFAVDQYYSAINQNVGAGVAVSDKLELFIKLDGISSLPKDVSAFGFYKLDGTTTPAVNALITLDVQSLLEKGYASLGDFEEGDKIAFWMETENGYIYSYYYDKSEKGNLRDAAYVKSNSTNNITIAMEPGLNPGPGYQPYKDVDYGKDFVFSVSNKSGGDVPVGQPLPGVLLGLMAGGGTLLGLRGLNRKA